MSSSPLEFWFEFGSTYSHIAAQRIEAVAARHGVEVRWIPFLLGPIFRSQGWNDSPFNIYPAKGAYMWRDMERECARHKIPFRRPSQFPRNGLTAARIVAAAAHEAWIPAFVRAVYLANFANDRDIASAAVLGELLGTAGCSDPAAFLALAESPETKQRLRDHTDRAIARGIFGAPTFCVGDELFWGSDRIDQAFAFAADGAGADAKTETIRA